MTDGSATVTQYRHVVQAIPEPGHSQQRAAMCASVIHHPRLVLRVQHTSKQCLGKDPVFCQKQNKIEDQCGDVKRQNRQRKPSTHRKLA